LITESGFACILGKKLVSKIVLEMESHWGLFWLKHTISLHLKNGTWEGPPAFHRGLQEPQNELTLLFQVHGWALGFTLQGSKATFPEWTMEMGE
jgi:hypothetical protein